MAQREGGLLGKDMQAQLESIDYSSSFEISNKQPLKRKRIQF